MMIQGGRGEIIFGLQLVVREREASRSWYRRVKDKSSQVTVPPLNPEF